MSKEQISRGLNKIYNNKLFIIHKSLNSESKQAIDASLEPTTSYNIVERVLHVPAFASFVDVQIVNQENMK